MDLFYRNSPAAGYTQVPMRLADASQRTFVAEIPADKVVPGYLEYYFEGNVGPFGPYGSTLERRPPYRVRVTDNNSKPVIAPTPPAGPVRGQAVDLSVDVQAQGRIRSVRVCYKRMPAPHEWVKMEMEPRGNGHYHASVPLTPEGILYYFEVADEDGNGANYPDFLQQTPYLVIPAWDAAAPGGEVK
jgi:hypothetical protein